MAYKEQLQPATAGRLSRDEAFRHLLMKLTHNMTRENVQELAIMGGLQLNARSGTQPPTAMEVLQQLWEKGDFSPNSCAGLDSLLRSIYRCDLADLVGKYMKQHDIQKPVQEMETRRGRDRSGLAVKRISSGPSTLSTSQDHDDGNEHSAQMMDAEDVPVRLTPDKPRRAFSYDQLEDGSPPSTMKSQVSWSSFPSSSQPRLQGSGEQSVTVSGEHESLHSSSSLPGMPQIAINIGNIHISNSDHSGNSSHSPLSPPAKGHAHSGQNSASHSSSKRPSSRHRKSSKEQERMSGMFSPLHEVSSSEEQFDDKKETDGAVNIMRPEVAADMSPVPSPKQEDKPHLSAKHIKGMRAEPTSESPKEGRKWKLFGKGSRTKRIRELTKQCIWVVEKDQLGSYIFSSKHRRSYIKCPKRLPVDVDCGDFNPYLSVQLYPFGLFADEGTSVTMLVKISIPDNCPPIPPTATYSLSWDICIVHEGNKGKLLGGSKKPMKVPFDKGIFYIHKFFPHTTIKNCNCDKFEIHIYTSYTCPDTSQEASGMAAKHMPVEETPTFEKLLSFRTGGGKVINIAMEVGEDYQRFGQFLLGDDTGTICKRISHSKSDAVSINQTILKQWVLGKGKQPVQWMTLLHVLKGIEMTELANQIEQNLQLNTVE